MTVLRSSEPVLGPARGWLMERRYQNPTYIAALLACRQPPGDLPDPMGALTEAHLALLRGDGKVALGGFGQRLTTGGDPDIWTGYAGAAHHAGEPAAA